MSARVIEFPVRPVESAAARVARMRLSWHEAVSALAMCAASDPDLVTRELDYIEVRRAQLMPEPQLPQA